MSELSNTWEYIENLEGNLEIWKSGNLDLDAKKSGLAGQPPDPDFLQKVKKSALKKSGLAKSGLWNDFFAKKGKKHKKGGSYMLPF